MNRSNKSKIAVTLLSALAFGANAQAQDSNKNKIVKTDSFQVNSTKTMQNSGKLGQVTGIVKGADWGKKALVITVVSLFGLETVHSIIGAATDSPFGSYSIGRAIKNRVKKNNQPGCPGKPEKKKPSKKIYDKKDDKKAEDKNLKTILGLFQESAQLANCEQVFSSIEQALRDFYKKIKNNELKYDDNKESIEYKLQEKLVYFFTHVKNYQRYFGNNKDIVLYDQNGTKIYIACFDVVMYQLTVTFNDLVDKIYFVKENETNNFRILYKGRPLF